MYTYEYQNKSYSPQLTFILINYDKMSKYLSNLDDVPVGHLCKITLRSDKTRISATYPQRKVGFKSLGTRLVDEREGKLA